MSAPVETLDWYFGLDEDARAQRAAQALAQSDQLKHATSLPSTLREPAAKALIWSVKALLTDPVSQVMVKAWSRYSEVRKLLTAPAGQANDITLHSHDIALQRKPALELVLNGAPTGLRFEFSLSIGLAVESALLTVKDKRIVAARLSRVHGEGKISCGNATIVERKTSEVKLPGSLSFNPGYPITSGA
jgi:hypothetical protein